MYKELEYQLGGSQKIIDDIKNFVLEHKAIILVLVLLIIVMFELNKNSIEGFKPVEIINKYIKRNYTGSDNVCNDHAKDTCSSTPGCEWVDGTWPSQGYCGMTESFKQ